jgi:predicted dehydrogenase
MSGPNGSSGWLADLWDRDSVDAPSITYRPPVPDGHHRIGLIGCGSITEQHLTAYRNAGFDVVAMADIDREAAVDKRDRFFPDADVYSDHEALLTRADIDVVDIATPPGVRPPLVEDALRADVHVLSQKPFVLDCDVGRDLIDLADDRGVTLAVNQNARWAPHLSYLRGLLTEGYLGTPCSLQASVHWDHDWIAGTPFDEIPHVILYDFAIHWFDLLTVVFAESEPRRVVASTARAPEQTATPPLLAQATVTYDTAQASLQFDGHARHGPEDRLALVGTAGSARTVGAEVGTPHRVLVSTASGVATPSLTGQWFPHGFEGAMAELLCAIEADREPRHSARDNLDTLELTFAAVQSAETCESVVPGTVQRMPDWSPPSR